MIIKSTHGRLKVHDYFSLLLCKSSLWFTEQHIFKLTLMDLPSSVKILVNLTSGKLKMV